MGYVTGDSRIQGLKSLTKDRIESASSQNENLDCAQHGRTAASEAAHAGKYKALRHNMADIGELEDAFSATKDTFTRLIERCWASTEKIDAAFVRRLRRTKETSRQFW